MKRSLEILSGFRVPLGRGTVDKPSAYLESSVVSHRAARPAHDVIALSHQEITHEWWENHLHEYTVYVSEVVLDEIRRGDPEAAAERLRAVVQYPLLPVGPEVERLAAVYQTELKFPEKALRDALHLALASIHEVDFLVTWNCRHIANAHIRRRLHELNNNEGVWTPIICTPEELLHDDDNPVAEM